ncbi:MAG: competence/damage-inducible protein A [Candidatus Schekmanbacteria bacterium]|nr:MAG: competence/damage-inducible protein A [Candidatus Schekmanbacteria bacterium]
MIAEIISIGTELLLGQILDTNSQYLSQKLAEIGVNLYFKQTTGDNVERIKEAINIALDRSDFIVLSGGLGPTGDDCTKNAVSQIVGKKLILNESAFQKLKEIFDVRGIKMSENNKIQAYFPEGAMIIENKNGTAPGFICSIKGKHIAALPGVPFEFKQMVDDSLIPFIKERAGGGKVIKSRVLRTIGMSESRLAEILEDIFNDSVNPSMAYLAGNSGIAIRITAKAEDIDEAEKMISHLERRIRDRIEGLIYGVDDETIEESVGKLLRAKGLSIAIAESCTGGLISSTITNTAGSSLYFDRGFVTYSNNAKIEMLSVPEKLINEKGAVSEEVAIEMARGARKKAGTDIGVGVTGIAGPGGGTAEKPVGLVYIALSAKDCEKVKEYRLGKLRLRNKHLTSLLAINMLRQYLIGVK